MRLAEFILENIEPILVEWVSYARSIWPAVSASPEELRDHAEEMLVAVAKQMAKPQSATQQKAKSLGEGEDQKGSGRLDGASHDHAVARSAAGFDLRQLVAEYRALRASVIRLWQISDPNPNSHDLEDLVRFNEAIDQLLAESVFTHTEHINRSREMFLGILGHDLRNPLAAVVGLSELLRYENLDSSSLELVSEITLHTDFMTKLIKDLLDFAAMRISNGFTISPVPMDLLPLCRGAVAEMEAIYPTRDFYFDHQGDLNGEWDGPRLKQLLSNLLGNAAQHGAEDQPIALSVKATDKNVMLAFRNQGAPIPAHKLKTIFDPMKRYATDDSSGSHNGAGLGLYIAHQIAAAHGGSIEIESDEQGTVFTVDLPRVARRTQRRGQSNAAL